MVSSSLSTAEKTETGLKVLEVSVLELYYWAPYGKRARMTITRIGKNFCIALPIQVGIVSMMPACCDSLTVRTLTSQEGGPEFNSISVKPFSPTFSLSYLFFSYFSYLFCFFFSPLLLFSCLFFPSFLHACCAA